MSDYFDKKIGTKIDGTYGVPVEYLSCPGCGRKYSICKTYCKSCEECKDCHSSNVCNDPNIVKVDHNLLMQLSERI